MSSKADVIIVGGGLVGLSCAHYLKEQGADVLLLDRGRYAESASAGNAGMIVPSHIIPLSAPGVIAKGLKWLMNPESPLYIKPSADPKFMKWLWLFQKHCTVAHVERSVPILRDLSLASKDLLTQLCALPGFENVGLEQDGLLMLHATEKSAKDNAELADIAEEAGLDIDRLDRDATMALEPALKTKVTGSVYFRQDASLDPERLMRALEAQVRNAGVRFLDAAVTGLKRSGNRVVAVKTAEGTFEADHVVMAAGSWTPSLVKGLGLSLPVQPAKGYSVTVPVDEPSIRIPCVLTDEKVTITPMPGSIRFAGTLALQGYDMSIDERRVRPIRRLAEVYCPPADVAAQETWAGFRPVSPDGLPYIGALSKTPNVYVATGHGMMGVTLAPITGRLIADRIGGYTPSLDDAPFSAERHA